MRFRDADRTVRVPNKYGGYDLEMEYDDPQPDPERERFITKVVQLGWRDWGYWSHRWWQARRRVRLLFGREAA